MVQKISSGQTFTDILNLRCDTDFERSNQFCFSYYNLASDYVSSDQVWLPRTQQFRMYSRKSHILIIWALAVTLTLKIATTTKCRHDWLMMLYHHTKFGTKCSAVDSETIILTNIQTFQTFLVTLTLNTVIPFFHRTLRLMKLYYQTKFGCKPISSLEDTTEIVIFWLYKPSPWSWHWRQ